MYQLYYQPEGIWVGDIMPYGKEGQFYVYHQRDTRNQGPFGEPFGWALATTKDFVDYKDYGESLKRGTDEEADQFIYAGSVFETEAGFHAFYTGHNPKKMPKEAIMHATSMDMKEWTKISEDTFFADEQYSGDDFRDPYVIYNEDYNEYWMLITTRKNNSGAIALYTSDDLRVWKDQGILFKNDMGTDSNLECPTLIKYG